MSAEPLTADQLIEALDLAADTKDRVLADRVPKLVAEIKRLYAELELAFSPSTYMEIQQVLDRALGTREADGAGAGIAAEVALLASLRDAAVTEGMKVATANDEIRRDRDKIRDATMNREAALIRLVDDLRGRGLVEVADDLTILLNGAVTS